CIDSRLSNKQATIITTNLELADLKEQYLDRTFSRLISGYTFLRMTGNDIRFQQKKLRQDTGK
ncbi:MAG: DNA replication protein DnaC, partial [Lachnospiraceae bacterium]